MFLCPFPNNPSLAQHFHGNVIEHHSAFCTVYRRACPLRLLSDRTDPKYLFVLLLLSLPPSHSAHPSMHPLSHDLHSYKPLTGGHSASIGLSTRGTSDAICYLMHNLFLLLSLNLPHHFSRPLACFKPSNPIESLQQGKRAMNNMEIGKKKQMTERKCRQKAPKRMV